MYRADEYRRVVEPLDIANYYVRNLPSKHTPPEHYSQHRPRSYCLIEKKWREKHPNKEDLKDDAMPVATQLAQEWEMANTQSDIRPSDSILNDRITEEWQERLKIF